MLRPNLLTPFRGQCLFALVAVAALSVPALAQQPTIRVSTRYRIKPDRIPDFQAAVKDYNAILQKQGWDRNSTVWQSLTGSYEYVFVSFLSKWAELDVTINSKLEDKNGERTRTSARMMQCVESMERSIAVVETSASLPRAETIPAMIRAYRALVKPEHTEDYLNLVKEDLLPAAKKAGMTTFTVSRTRFGGPTSEFRTATAYSHWADLDDMAGVRKAMGEEAYQRFLAKLRPMVIESRYDMLRYRPELSYRPAATTLPSGGR